MSEVDKNNIVRRPRREANSNKNISYSFDGISFPSMSEAQHGSLRVSCNTTSDGVIIWTESKGTKQQWQTTVTDINDHGPGLIPIEAIFCFLQKALQSTAEGGTSSSADPVVDMELSDIGATLILTLNMNDIWKPEFVFQLLPVALEPVDILTAQVRDATDEIRALWSQLNGLKVADEICFVLVKGRLNAPWNANTLCPWGEVEGIARDLVTIQDTSITVQKAGWYQISVSCCPSQTLYQTWVSYYTLTLPTGARQFTNTLLEFVQLNENANITLTNQQGAHVNWGAQAGHYQRPNITFTWIHK